MIVTHFRRKDFSQHNGKLGYYIHIQKQHMKDIDGGLELHKRNIFAT